MQSNASTASSDSISGEDLLWDSTPPTSLAAPISPPPLDNRPPKRPKRGPQSHNLEATPSPALAAIEAGEARIDDHLAYFTKHLSQVARPCIRGLPRLSIADFGKLYERNGNAHGHHFVIHQHDHPVAGVHYDLRLQFSESSSVSFAIPFGVPGDANSLRMGRMAMETRVHNIWVCVWCCYVDFSGASFLGSLILFCACFQDAVYLSTLKAVYTLMQANTARQNHLIESASHATGSMLIWDTGEYSILPSGQRLSQSRIKGSSSNSDTDSDSSNPINQNIPENEKLQQAFRTVRILPQHE